MKIAVTGGLGSGKSTVSKLLASSLQCELINTDQLCRKQLQPGAEGLKKFQEVFGGRFLHPDGTVNRQILREVTFKDQRIKSQLEAILHPIISEIVNQKWNQREGSIEHLVIEVPLLYEVQWQDDFDECIVVYLPEHLVYERVALRSGLSFEEIRSILQAQMPIEEKRTHTQFIVDNSTTFASSVLQVAYLVKTLVS
ncbi:MAG: dephospho-CoA kinase [Desulfobulbaceae bacterium S3730MH12]|nr:MAG: dephospho-CoA kinase [Desulfobulbaceae bacterium S5133MH15]OEU54237.1 MAG: dephospho-CoA kinase [Desulfobulbaceae bacterium S3730MH12]OEU82687.1 MAG: dephospho-CoA kinase [Desulfobulbaceae bacterium C00003063]